MMVRGELAMTREKGFERDWREYNEHLVQRREILPDVESLQGWQEELFKMNQGKNGRPFRHPHSLMSFLGTLRVVFSLPYRQLEGLARGLGKDDRYPHFRLQYPKVYNKVI
jgi:hypothetical protein